MCGLACESTGAQLPSVRAVAADDDKTLGEFDAYCETIRKLRIRLFTEQYAESRDSGETICETICETISGARILAGVAVRRARRVLSGESEPSPLRCVTRHSHRECERHRRDANSRGPLVCRTSRRKVRVAGGATLSR